MTPFVLWQRWLVVAGCVIVVFGLALALLNQTAPFNVTFNSHVDPVFWPAGGPTPSDKAFQQWIYGVLGATVVGWGIVLTFIAAGPFARKERWAWRCLAVSVGTWFIVDTAISLGFGVAVNVVFNTILLAAVAVALLATRRAFRKKVDP